MAEFTFMPGILKIPAKCITWHELIGFINSFRNMWLSRKNAKKNSTSVLPIAAGCHKVRTAVCCSRAEGGTNINILILI